MARGRVRPHVSCAGCNPSFDVDWYPLSAFPPPLATQASDSHEQ